jgi:hypothetical protein
MEKTTKRLPEESLEPRRAGTTELLETARRFRSTLTFETTEKEIAEAKRKGRQ